MTADTLIGGRGQLLLTLAVVVSLVLACGEVTAPDDGAAQDPDTGSEEQTGSTAGEGDRHESRPELTVACLPIDLALEVFLNICEGVKAAGEALGATVEIGDGQSDPARQAQLMENYTERGVDVVVVVAQDPGSFYASMHRGQEAGVLVSAFGTRLDGADVEVAFAFYEGGLIRGEAAAEYINENMGGEAEVLVFDFPAVPVLQDLAQGTSDAIEEHAPGATVVKRLPANSREQGLQAAAAALQEFPNIRVVTCISDDSCLGAERAFQEAGISADEIFLIGTDVTRSAMQALEQNEGGFRASVGYGQFVGGVTGVLRAVDCLDGADLARTVWLDEHVVTAENVQQWQAREADPVETYYSHFGLYFSELDATPERAECPPPSRS